MKEDPLIPDHNLILVSALLLKFKFFNIEDLWIYLSPPDEDIKKGSWVMVTHCASDEVWEAVKKGDFTGYSIRGFASRS